MPQMPPGPAMQLPPPPQQFFGGGIGYDGSSYPIPFGQQSGHMARYCPFFPGLLRAENQALKDLAIEDHNSLFTELCI